MKRLFDLSLLAFLALALSSCGFSSSKICFELSSKTLTEMDKIFPGEDVYLNNCTEDGMAYLWDFGDGTTSELKSPHHTWEDAGDYTIKLTVETEKSSATKEQQITVSPSLYGTWSGVIDQNESTIPITFKIVQEGSKLKGEFNYASGVLPGIINSHSYVVNDSIYIDCSYVYSISFNGETMTIKYNYLFEGIVNQAMDQLSGDHFYRNDYPYDSWVLTKQ